MFPLFALTLAVLLSFGVAAFGCWLLLIAILRLTKCEPPIQPQDHQHATDAETLSLPAVESGPAPEAAPEHSELSAGANNEALETPSAS